VIPADELFEHELGDDEALETTMPGSSATSDRGIG
jgi:hypothetical protein